MPLPPLNSRTLAAAHPAHFPIRCPWSHTPEAEALTAAALDDRMDEAVVFDRMLTRRLRLDGAR